MSDHSSKLRRCLRCGGELEIGSIPDRYHHNLRRPGEWEGPKPQAPKVLGMPIWQPAGDRIEIVAYRCPACGMLELVAGGSGPL